MVYAKYLKVGSKVKRGDSVYTLIKKEFFPTKEARSETDKNAEYKLTWDNNISQIVEGNMNLDQIGGRGKRRSVKKGRSINKRRRVNKRKTYKKRS
jgi:hypothetical protein